MTNASRFDRTRRPANHLTEMVAVLLLGIATIGTAWCGYQASRWNSEQEDLAREGSDLRIEANRAFGRGIQTVAYDANLVAQYANAVSNGDTRLQEFYRTTLMRPDFLPVLEHWEDAVRAGETPTNLLEDRDYLAGELGGFESTQAAAEAADQDAKDAGQNGDDYVLITLLLATALFFAGVTTSFRVPAAQLVLLTLASLAIAYALAQLASLPVA